MVRYLKGVGKAVLGYAGKRLAYAGVKKAESFGKSLYRRFRRRGRGGSVTKPLTQQRDMRTTFVRNRNSRQWRRFRSRVRAALQADNPRHVYQAVYKSSGTVTDSIAGFDGVYFLDLNTTSQGDIYNVFKDVHGLATVADNDNYKIYIQSARMDFMVTNTNASTPCELDVYECVARRDDTQTGTPGTLWTTYFADLDAVGTVTSQHPSLTPYDIPNFIRSWKVRKTTKFSIQPGKSIQMSMVSRLNRVFNGVKLSQSVTILKGITRMFFFRVRGVANNSTPTGSRPASGLSGWDVSWSALTSINYQSLPTADQSEDIDQSK